MPRNRPFDQLLKTLEQQHAVCHRRQAYELGVTSKSLRCAVESSRLVRVDHGVFRLAGWPSSYEQDVLIAALASNDPLGVGSRRAAARIHGFEGFANAPVEVTVSEQFRAYCRDNVTIHCTNRRLGEDRVVVNGVPVTDKIRTVIDLAAELRPEQLAKLLDSLERDSLVLRHELEYRLNRLRKSGRNGVGVLARELEARNAPGRNPASPLERDFLSLVERHFVERPVCQVKIMLGDGSLAVVDFAFLELMLVVETDGQAGHASPAQRAADERRRDQLRRLGFEVQVFTGEQVRENPRDTVRRLRAAMDHRRRLLRSGAIQLDAAKIEAWRRGDIV